jgi:hypothetical protein
LSPGHIRKVRLYFIIRGYILPVGNWEQGTLFVQSVLETRAREWLLASVNKKFPTYRPRKANQERDLV